MKLHIHVVIATTILGLASLATAKADSIQYRNVQVATVLNEVQRGSVDGRDYLTIHIDGEPTGPMACRSTVLTVDTDRATREDPQGSVEAVALSAMLNQEPVMITVPTDPAVCRRGRPTFTNLYLLPASP